MRARTYQCYTTCSNVMQVALRTHLVIALRRRNSRSLDIYTFLPLARRVYARSFNKRKIRHVPESILAPR